MPKILESVIALVVPLVTGCATAFSITGQPSLILQTEEYADPPFVLNGKLLLVSLDNKTDGCKGIETSALGPFVLGLGTALAATLATLPALGGSLSPTESTLYLGLIGWSLRACTA